MKAAASIRLIHKPSQPGICLDGDRQRHTIKMTKKSIMLLRTRIFALILFLFCILICRAQESSIHFTTGSLQQALAIAKASNKPIFLYGTTVWCHFCKEMEKDVFPQKQVSGYFNTNFINVELDFDKTPGDSLAKQYGITTFPAYLFFDKEGALLHIATASKPANEFIQDAKNAFIEDSAYSALKARYDKGERTPGLLYCYSNALIATAGFDKIQLKVEQQYLQVLDSNAIKSPQNLRYLLNHTHNRFDAPATKYYMQYYQALCDAFGSNEVKHQTTFLISWETERVAQKNDTTQLKALKKTLITHTGNQGPQLAKLADVKFAMGCFVKNKTNWKAYVAATSQYASVYAKDDPFPIHEAAVYLLAFGEDPKILPEAARLIKKAIQVHKTYDYYLDLAKIYHKMGQETNAVSMATMAITAGTTEKADTSDAKELLLEIKKGKSGKS